jgi:hypothetical protein
LHVSGGNIQMNNNYGLWGKGTGGGSVPMIVLDSSDLVNIGNWNSGGVSDQIVFYTTLGERMRINGGGNVTIDSNTLFVDATNNKVGIGTTSPAQKLDVNGSVYLGGNLTVNESSDSMVEMSVTTLRQVNTWSPGGYYPGIFVSGKYLYVSPDNLTVYDLTDPANPTLIGRSSVSIPQSESMYVAGKYLYGHSYGEGWFEIYDISNPVQPILVFSNQTGGMCSGKRCIEAAGKYVYIAALYTGLQIWDVSDASSPTRISNSGLGMGYDKLKIYGQNAYIVGHGDGCDTSSNGKLLIVNISNPYSPTEINRTSIPGNYCPTVIDVSGSYAFIGTGQNVTFIYNITNASHPTYVSNVTQANRIWGSLEVRGKYLFIATIDDLTITDITNISSPRQVALQQPACSDFAISGKYIYCTGNKIYEFGTETPALLAHSAEAGSLKVTGSAQIGDKLDIGTGLTVGPLGILSQGDVGISKGLTISGNVGIGTTSPASMLQVVGGTGATIGILISDTVADATAKTARIQMPSYTTANPPMMMMYAASSASTNQLRIGGGSSSAYAATSITFLTGATNTTTTGTNRMVISSTGDVGIGTDTPDHDLEIGTGTYSEIDAGEAQFATSSSRTYKENIKPVVVDGILDKISEIPVTTYDFREEYCNNTENIDKCKNKIGLIAENFHVIFGRGSDKELSGQEVQMALWLAVQEQQSQMEEQHKEIEKQQNEIEDLKKMIELLENKKT